MSDALKRLEPLRHVRANPLEVAHFEAGPTARRRKVFTKFEIASRADVADVDLGEPVAA